MTFEQRVVRRLLSFCFKSPFLYLCRKTKNKNKNMKTGIALLLLFVSSYLPLYAQQQISLFPFYKDSNQKKLCFVDNKGKLVLEVPYKAVEYPYQQYGSSTQLKNNFFYEGYCLLNVKDEKTDEPILLIYNTQGNLIKKIPQLYAYSNFHEGYAVVFAEDKSKCYMMNKNFELEKEFPFSKVVFDESGIGIVYQGNSYKQVKYCNTQGKYLSEKVFEYQKDDFIYGTTFVKLDEKQVFLNEKIEVIAVATPQEMMDNPYTKPTDGAVVLFNNVEGKPQGISRVIDKTGKEININPQIKPSIVAYVGDGLFVKREEEGYHIFVNADGKQAMPLAFEWIQKTEYSEGSRYSDGLAWVKKWEGGYFTKCYIYKLLDVKAGKVLVERKVAPKFSYILLNVDFAFLGKLNRIGFQYFINVFFTVKTNNFFFSMSLPLSKTLFITALLCFVQFIISSFVSQNKTGLSLVKSGFSVFCFLFSSSMS